MSYDILHFGWNTDEELKNIHRYEISFAEASNIFYSSKSLMLRGRNGSEPDLMIGISSMDTGTAVCMFEQREGIIHILGARKATEKEEKTYERIRKLY